MKNHIILGIWVHKTPETEKFFLDRASFLKNTHDMARNPYVGGIDRKEDPKGVQYTFVLEPLFPRVYWFGIPLLAVTAVLTNFMPSFWYIPGLIMSSTFLLFWPPIYYLGCRAGLRKAGYKGPCLLIMRKKKLTAAVNRFIEGNTAL